MASLFTCCESIGEWRKLLWKPYYFPVLLLDGILAMCYYYFIYINGLL